MSRMKLAALAALLILAAPASAVFARGGHSGGSHSSSSHSHRSSGGSHHVSSYIRSVGTYVRPHYAGNPESGNHWQLNHDGSDTLTRPDGTTSTVPSVPQ